jgi:hypothetical protein
MSFSTSANAPDYTSLPSSSSPGSSDPSSPSSPPDSAASANRLLGPEVASSIRSVAAELADLKQLMEKVDGEIRQTSAAWLTTTDEKVRTFLQEQLQHLRIKEKSMLIKEEHLCDLEVRLLDEKMRKVREDELLVSQKVVWQACTKHGFAKSVAFCFGVCELHLFLFAISGFPQGDC